MENIKIAVLGLGYVGLPLAVELSTKYVTVGFDLDSKRIEALKNGVDDTLEVGAIELKQASNLKLSGSIKDIKECNVYIITVPTPIDGNKQPDLRPLISASEMVGDILSTNDVVIYESTVYPGATEEICKPILEKRSSLKFNHGFFLGYSPERINPGDKEHRLTSIIKVTSGSTTAAADLIDKIYGSIITAGTYRASSIKVAEAAKVIENTQRDVNIALVNELAMIFNKLGIDTEEVLKAAGTKWNFLPFRPGLVGGHCIGVDPYYLTFKAQAVGYNPEMILAGRRINDGMGKYVVSRLVKALIKQSIPINKSKVLVMGLTFKENCPDIRNTRVVDIISELNEYGMDVDCYDPWVASEDAKDMLGFSPLKHLDTETYDAIILAVKHSSFIQKGVNSIRRLGKSDHVIFDLKHLFPVNDTDLRL